MQGLVCPEGPSMTVGGVVRVREEPLLFIKKKDLFPRASANTPRYRYRDKILMGVLELDWVKGDENLTRLSGPLPQVCEPP